MVKEGEWRPAALAKGTAGRGVHEDVLAGRDTEVAWEDVFHGMFLPSCEQGSSPRNGCGCDL